MERQYSLFDAKAKLSELIRLVEAGNEVVVTVRGRKVARILPYAREESSDERFERLVSTGRIRSPKVTKLAARKPTLHPSTGVLERFLAERD